MIKDSLFAFFRTKKHHDPSGSPLPIRIQQVNYFPAGREHYIRERTKILNQLKPAPEDPEGKNNRALVFEQFSFEDCFFLCVFPTGPLYFLSDKGRSILADFTDATHPEWENASALAASLLSFTTKRDDFPLTGFGHASFFFVHGRNIFVNRKHIPIMEKEQNGFHKLHIFLLELKQNILDLS